VPTNPSPPLHLRTTTCALATHTHTHTHTQAFQREFCKNVRLTNISGIHGNLF